MATRDDYAPVIAALEQAGFAHSLRDYREKGYALVCVAERSSEGELSGPSFWLLRASSGRWFVAEWGGHPAFALPVGADPTAVCVACLKKMDGCMGIPPEVVTAFGLEALRPSQIVGFDLAEG